MTTLRTIATIATLGCLLALSACDSALPDEDASATGLTAEIRRDTTGTTALCHLDQTEDTYFRIAVAEEETTLHLGHGDKYFNPSPRDTDPSDGDLYCEPAPDYTPGACSASRIAFSSNRAPHVQHFQIYTMAQDGSDVQRITFYEEDSGQDSKPVLSPDGQYVAFVRTNHRITGNYDIWVAKIDGSDPVRLTSDAARDDHPAWAPDSYTLAFQTNRDGNKEIYEIKRDGTGLKNLTNYDKGSVSRAEDSHPSYSPDGTKIVFTSRRRSQNELAELYTMKADGSQQKRVFPTGNATYDMFADQPVWSPDGQTIAFTGNIPREVFVIPADGSAGPTALTNGFFDGTDNYDPAYSPSGSYLLYTSDIGGNFDIWRMTPDGSYKTNLTNFDGVDSHPSWACVE